MRAKEEIEREKQITITAYLQPSQLAGKEADPCRLTLSHLEVGLDLHSRLYTAAERMTGCDQLKGS